GQVLFQTDPAVTTRYLFTGREFDRETGLYYYRARYYDPATGRFLSEDPARFNGGDLSWDPYVRKDPLGGLHPTGRYRVRAGESADILLDISTLGVTIIGFKLDEAGEARGALRELHLLRREAYEVLSDANRSDISSADLDRDADQVGSIDFDANGVVRRA